MNNLNILEAYELEMVGIEEQCEVKDKQKNKICRHKINKKFKDKDRKGSITWRERELKACLRKKAERKVRRTPIGKENFALKGCGYHKVFEWRYDL